MTVGTASPERFLDGQFYVVSGVTEKVCTTDVRVVLAEECTAHKWFRVVRGKKRGIEPPFRLTVVSYY